MTSIPLAPLGRETLDDPGCSPAVARATLRDIATANALFGGRWAAAFGLDMLLRAGALPTRPLRLLDLGAGSGDVARYLQGWGRRRGVPIRPVTLDVNREAVRLSRRANLLSVRADVAAIPLQPKSVDIVLASQLVHHFHPEGARTVLRAVDSLAALGVIVADLRRTRVAAAGIWLASLALGFHGATRRDGVLSVRRGYRAAELAALLEGAGIRTPVHRRPGFRLVAAWRTDRAHGG